MQMRRRTWLKGSGVVAVTCATDAALRGVASAAGVPGIDSWIAVPPAGFTPLALPGRVSVARSKLTFADLMQPNQLWPKAEPAKALLEKALCQLTGDSTLVGALKRFIHPADKVAVKVNGIAGQRGATMAVNFEFILPLVEALLELGVAADKLVVFEQFGNFLAGTRVNVAANRLPAGVRVETHDNYRAKMPEVIVFNRVKTRYVQQVTDATAIIDMTMMKHHSLCGFTGAMKNMTHGQIINPHDHHSHLCNPQIPLLYNFPVLRSRVRLHLVDACKIIYDEGPLDTNPAKRVPHGAVYAATDPVALDRIGWDVIERERKERKAPSLATIARSPDYILTAGDLGLGIADLNQIRLLEATI
jgi:uncharacterized protein (DUF362 family)